MYPLIIISLLLWTVSFSNLGQANSTTTLCEEIGNKLGSVSIEDCLKQNFQSDSAIRTKHERPVLYKTIKKNFNSNQQLLNPRVKNILLLGGIHGDEFSSISIIFKWLDFLNKSNRVEFNWQIIPLLNPDGLLQSNQSTRQNANGIDLNRNFPTKDWELLALNYWNKNSKRNPRRFPGRQANSEIETQWFTRTIEKFKPDFIITVHAPHNLVDYNGPKEGPKKIGNLKHQLFENYPGSLGSYAGLKLNIPTITIELPYAGILPSDKEIQNMWTDLNSWIAEQ